MQSILLGTLERLERCFTTLSIKPLLIRILLKQRSKRSNVPMQSAKPKVAKWRDCSFSYRDFTIPPNRHFLLTTFCYDLNHLHSYKFSPRKIENFFCIVTKDIKQIKSN